MGSEVQCTMVAVAKVAGENAKRSNREESAKKDNCCQWLERSISLQLQGEKRGWRVTQIGRSEGEHARDGRSVAL